MSSSSSSSSAAFPLPVPWLVVGAGLALLAWIAYRRVSQAAEALTAEAEAAADLNGTSLPAELAAEVAEAVVDGAAGVVLGVGDAIGIPRTSRTACDEARASGSWWDRSRYCTAGEFLGDALDYITPSSSSASVSGSW